LLFRVGGEVARVQELVDKVLIFANAVAEHAPVITVIVHAPLHFDNISGSVGYHGSISPVGSRLIVVYANPSIVTTGTTPAYLCSGNIRPGGNGLEDSAFRTRI
jgi:hypothetical protein